jgi:hypothetical protein
MSGEYSKFLAPYQAQIKQLTDKSGDFKGLPLKTSLRVMLGGQQCSAVAKMKANGSANGDNSAGGGNPMSNVAQAGKAIGSSVSNLVGGLFHKKKADDSQTAASAAPDAAAASAAPTPSGATASTDPYAQYVQMAAFTSETVTINTDAVPAGRFEIPPDWKKDVPKAAAKGDEEFTCPKSGS